MILEFTIENYRSFREQQTLFLTPDKGKHEFGENIFKNGDKIQVLKTCVVYGANASGKSNLLKAMQTLRTLVLQSAKYEPENIFEEYDPFKFNPDTENAPTNFSLEFIINETRYRYRVGILNKEVLEESLFFFPQGREAKLFNRKKQNFDFGDSLKGQKVIVSEITGKNQLFLSKAAINNIKQLIEVFNFFNHSFMTIPFLNSWMDSYYTDRIAKELKELKGNDFFVQNFNNLLKSFDTGIVDFSIERNELSLSSEYEIFVEHNVYDNSGKEYGKKPHSLNHESTGTQKLFVLGGLVLRALMNGRIIVIDEFERSLHPFITKFIIQMFHNPKLNINGAQLLIATHDTHLLSNSDLRRDQIWLVEKDNYGASEIFSFADINGIRNDIPFEKWYLAGRVGGVPGLSRLNFELNFRHENK